MKFDLTITLSIIIVTITTLSPIAVAFLNNRHQFKIKKLELFELEKRNSLKNFIDTSIECFNQDNWINNKEFIKALYTLQLYFKSADVKLIDKINKVIISNPDKDKFKMSFVSVISVLAKEVQKH